MKVLIVGSGDILLEPTKIYVKSVLEVLKDYDIKGMAHITGGGFFENIPRMFKEKLAAVIYRDSYDLPEIFKYIMNKGVSEEHMYNTFNMGIGFVLCVNKEDSKSIVELLNKLGEQAYIIGKVQAGGEGVCLI